jgi:UDP-N-acetylmuramate dehydrogenase
MELSKTVGEYSNNYNLSHLTWFKVGGPAEILLKPLDVQDLANFVQP